MPRQRPPYLNLHRTRHGKIMWFVRRGHGPRIRLLAYYNTREFWAEYRDVLLGVTPARTRAAPRTHSLAWAIEKYRRSSDWATLATAPVSNGRTFLERSRRRQEPQDSPISLMTTLGQGGKIARRLRIRQTTFSKPCGGCSPGPSSTSTSRSTQPKASLCSRGATTSMDSTPGPRSR